MEEVTDPTQPGGRRIVIGVGNPLRSDDGIGLAVIGRFYQRLSAMSAIVRAGVELSDEEPGLKPVHGLADGGPQRGSNVILRQAAPLPAHMVHPPLRERSLDKSSDTQELVRPRGDARAFGRDEQAPSYVVIESTGEGAALMELWHSNDRVVVVDAARSLSLPGRVHRFDAHARKIPSDFLCYSTHAFGVAEAVEMSRTLGRLPRQLVLYAVEGRSFHPGHGLSIEVAAVIDDVVTRIAGEFADH